MAGKVHATKTVVSRVSGVILVWLGLACGAGPRDAGLERFEFRERHMGAEARIVLYAARTGRFLTHAETIQV